MEKFTKLPGSGAFYVYPLLTTASPIQHFVLSAAEPEKEADVACTSGSSTEEYVIELPKTVKVLSVPDDLKIANAFLSYQATSRLKGNILTVKRTFDDRTKGNICSPQIVMEYRRFAEKVMDNLKAQVLYK
jgi:hypothetical protein